MSNLLGREKSPYLLQHAGNPVDWRPWGDAAFEEARSSQKPIFLSIGYSTCHWCHVMAHESFEDADVAALLNREFVAIKVDREERPDVDRVYMTFVQATTGSGGWPLSVWLTPGLEPFYGGTYFPPTSRFGRPGFIDLLRDIARVWHTNPFDLLRAAREVTTRLQQLGRTPTSPVVPQPETLARAVDDFRAAYDWRHGGFGGAPKFPRPSDILFLLREFARGGNAEARKMALETLQAIAAGGVHDHLGGGFHRYAVDEAWRVPHFEKMLYDQAQLTLAYTEAARVTGEGSYSRVAQATIGYVQRCLTDRAGGFYSAEDADSLPPGSPPGTGTAEGRFYLWTAAEIADLLGEDAHLVRLRYGVESEGNAPTDPHGDFTGRNILFAARSIDDVARLAGRDRREVGARLEYATRLLHARRDTRPRPHLDDKVLAGWNGLMIAACARAARLLDLDPATRTGCLASAERAASFIRTTMWQNESGVLMRRFRDGEAAIEAYAEDYAFLISGLLELFQADHDPDWLEWALALQVRQDAVFWDANAGGWFSTSAEDASILLRVKDQHDAAEPSASSVAVLNLLALSHLTGDRSMGDRIEQTLRLFGAQLEGAPRAAPMMMAALATYWAGVRQVVIVGDGAGADTRTLVDTYNASFQPFTLLIVVEPGAHQGRVARLIPGVAAMMPLDGRATAYVCRDFACQQPTSDPEVLDRQLSG